MRKITSLLMLFCAFVATAWAGPTDLPEVSTEDNIKWYTIKNVRKQKFATYAGDNASMTQQANVSAASFFYFTASGTEGAVKIHNYVAGDKLCAAYNSWTTDGRDWYLTVQSTGVSISTASGAGDAWNDARGEGQVIEYWTANDAGSAWEIAPVTDFSSVINVPAVKTAAKTKLNDLKKLFSADATTIDAAIDAIDAINAADNSLSALNAAVVAVETKLNETYAAVYEGKNIRLTTTGRNAAGNDLTVKSNGVFGTTNSGDAGIWTMKGNDDGTFSLYNFVSNLYLGPTVGMSAHVPGKETLAEAGHYTFNLYEGDVNKLNIICNGNNLHLAGGLTVVQWWDNAGGASQWKMELCKDIVVSREIYDNASAAAASLPYAIQQAYGLVTDAANYYSNYKSTAEGSYEALLDNVTSTYFHSAYGEEPGDGSGVHYIQATLAEGVDEFYFYMLPRSGNGNNRPKDITVYGSNDGETFTEICQVTTTLDATMNPYLSAKLGTAGTTYKYIRLTVNSTNSGTKFFTLSELYFLPANQDVTNLVNAYKNFASSSITSAEMATAATALINAETVLALSNIKKEVNALLTANATNHAETPALGQYSTAAYNALQAAYNAADATQESLETAIAAFKKAKNVPVYFITSKHNGYAAGSAIYYDGAWKWKTANKYDKQMWMTIPDYNQANVPAVEAYDAEGTSYAICDYLTGTKMRGKDVQIVKVADWEGAYNLQYNADATSTDAAQHAKDTKDLVGWTPGTKNDAQASVWGVEYIGSSYELDQLTDAHIEAVSALYTSATANAKYVGVEIGSGLGQYTGNKEAFNTAIADAQAIQSKTVLEVAAMNVADITAITTALTESAATFKLNMPTAGFYRVKSMNANDANKKGKYWQSKEDASGMELAAEKDDARSIIYLGEDNSVTSYGCGYALNQYAGMDAAGTEGKAWTITENAAVPATYALYRNGDTYCLSDWYGVTYGQNDANAAWAIEEVTVLPVKVSAAGYATLYAPVALTLPAEGLKAYTVTVNGESAMLNEIEGGVIPANTGVVLEGAGDYTLTVGGEATAVEGNDLLGTVAASYVTDAAYVLGYINVAEEGQPENKQVGFYTATKNQQGNTSWLNNGFKAYLPKNQGASLALRFNFGETTGIEGVIENTNANAVIFDLSGRRVAKMQKGIYIVNGKKVYVK